MFNPVASKLHAANFHSRPWTSNETLQEYIIRITDLVIHVTDAYPTSVNCQVTIILFIRHLFNKEIKKQVAGAKNIQTLRHAMTLAQELQINLIKYKGLNYYDSSVMQVSAVPHSEVLAVQGQSNLHENIMEPDTIFECTPD